MKSLFTFCGKHGQLLFILSLLIIFYLFDFHIKVSQLPHGIHFIRQTDCLSFVANYYQHGFDFFTPQLFTLNNDNGRAVCEFPILYYITALLCLVVYEPVFILKLLTLIILSIGFLYLFKLLQNLFQSIFYAWVFSLLFLSSTILFYYSVNVLPDPAALGFTLIGWFHIFNFRNKRFAHTWGFIFFSLASLLKVTFFIYPLAAVLFLCFGNRKTGNVLSKRAVLESFFISAAVVLIWTMYVLDYNSENHAESFLLKALPIWNLTGQEIEVVTDHIFNYWHSEYYYPTTQHLFFIIAMLSVGFICRMERGLLLLWSTLILGSAAFIVLFFPQFKDHDYYFITVLPALILVVAIAFTTIQKVIPITLNTWFVKGIFALICFLSLNYAGKKLEQREQLPPDPYSLVSSKLAHADLILDSLNISRTAKIIVYPDYTPNGGLFMLNRPGWGISDMKGLLAIKANAQYIVLMDSAIYEEFPQYKMLYQTAGFKLFQESH